MFIKQIGLFIVLIVLYIVLFVLGMMASLPQSASITMTEKVVNWAIAIAGAASIGYIAMLTVGDIQDSMDASSEGFY